MKQNIIKKVISVFLCFIFSTTVALADTVLLKSGKEINGEILEFRLIKIQPIQNGVRIYSLGPDRIDQNGAINILTANERQRTGKSREIPTGDIVFQITR